MELMPILDFGAGVLMWWFSLFLPLWGVPAILIEALLLDRLLPQARALRDSLIINLVSTAAGLVVGYLASRPLLSEVINRLGLDHDEFYYYVDPTALKLDLGALLLVLWVPSVLIEGALLQLWLERQIKPWPLWRAVLVVNSASYAAVPIILAIWAWSQ